MSAKIKDEKVIDVAGFIKNSGAEDILIDLKKHFDNKPTIFSDVYDDKGNQYVDLVQEGGGVWGIALLGYTYILEQMGIRFFSLAGTSAGAINTMLMAVTNKKDEVKAPQIIAQVLALDFFSFVDGKKYNWIVTKWVKRIIQKFILKKNYVKRMLLTFAALLLLLIGFSTATFITVFTAKPAVIHWLAICAIFFGAIVLFIIIFIIVRIKTIAKTGYGLNEGRAFYNWMTKMLHANDVQDLTDLKTQFCSVPKTLKVRRDDMRDAEVKGEVLPPTSPMLVIVASDITTGNKIEFPRMWDMYWKEQKDVNPAAFVRASMSIPVFFETYKIPVAIEPQAAALIWKDHLNWNGEIPKQVEMVDGGALSNFPINVFYNAKYIIPRMPTFGIRLGGTGVETVNKINSVGGFISSIISTLRSNTDKEFINKNKAFELGVKEVDLSEYSWLNFFMNDEDKKAIFKKGAAAAADFLKTFDWKTYKAERLNNNKVMEEQMKNPNNW